MAITVVETLRKALTSKAACHGAGTTVPILCELHLPLQYLMRDELRDRRSATEKNGHDSAAKKFSRSALTEEKIIAG